MGRRAGPRRRGGEIELAPWRGRSASRGAGNAPRADAVITRMPSLAVAITTADCGPVLLADPQAQVVGAAHVGWKGALSGILEATIAAMESGTADREQPEEARGPRFCDDDDIATRGGMT